MASATTASPADNTTERSAGTGERLRRLRETRRLYLGDRPEQPIKRPRGRKRWQRVKIDPEQLKKKRARDKVYAAIKSGRLIPQPCACGAEKTEAHHSRGYENPLDVDWFCRPCHMREHGQLHEKKTTR